MEISKMLTISTAHISKETAKMLEVDNYGRIVIVYKKDSYGWFILVPDDINEYKCNELEIPIDLFKCLQLAKDLGCGWLCLDRDGEVLDYLDVYEW